MGWPKDGLNPRLALKYLDLITIKFGNQVLKDNQLILEMKNISKTFSGVRALDDVSISCKKGSIHALVGENGAGKSTLIKILSGAQQPDKGTICFRGKNYESFSTREALNFGISVIYQELALV